MNTARILTIATALLAGTGTGRASNASTAVNDPVSNRSSHTPCPFTRICTPDRLDYTVETVWGSKYEGEGLNLWGSSYTAISIAAECNDLIFKTWYGVADSANHGELKYRLEYKREIGRLTIMPWYEHSFVFPGDRGIPRPGIKMAWHFNKTFFAGPDVYWQEVNGRMLGYYAAFAGAQFKPASSLLLDTTLRYGYNGGYVGGTIPRGSNALDYYITLTWKYDERIELDLHASYSQALTTLRSQHRGNDFYYGARIRINF